MASSYCLNFEICFSTAAMLTLDLFYISYNLPALPSYSAKRNFSPNSQTYFLNFQSYSVACTSFPPADSVLRVYSLSQPDSASDEVVFSFEAAPSCSLKSVWKGIQLGPQGLLACVLTALAGQGFLGRGTISAFGYFLNMLQLLPYFPSFPSYYSPALRWSKAHCPNKSRMRPRKVQNLNEFSMIALSTSKTVAVLERQYTFQWELCPNMNPSRLYVFPLYITLCSCLFFAINCPYTTYTKDGFNVTLEIKSFCLILQKGKNDKNLAFSLGSIYERKLVHSGVKNLAIFFYYTVQNCQKDRLTTSRLANCPACTSDRWPRMRFLSGMRSIANKSIILSAMITPSDSPVIVLACFSSYPSTAPWPIESPTSKGTPFPTALPSAMTPTQSTVSPSFARHWLRVKTKMWMRSSRESSSSGASTCRKATPCLKTERSWRFFDYFPSGLFYLDFIDIFILTTPTHAIEKKEQMNSICSQHVGNHTQATATSNTLSNLYPSFPSPLLSPLTYYLIINIFHHNNGLQQVRLGGPRGQDQLRSPRGQARHHRRHPQRQARPRRRRRYPETGHPHPQTPTHTPTPQDRPRSQDRKGQNRHRQGRRRQEICRQLHRQSLCQTATQAEFDRFREIQSARFEEKIGQAYQSQAQQEMIHPYLNTHPCLTTINFTQKHNALHYSLGNDH